MTVTVVENATGKRLTGEEAPLASQLQSWLELHPGWEVVPREEEGDDSEGSESEDEEMSESKSYKYN